MSSSVDEIGGTDRDAGRDAETVEVDVAAGALGGRFLNSSSVLIEFARDQRRQRVDARVGIGPVAASSIIGPAPAASIISPMIERPDTACRPCAP